MNTLKIMLRLSAVTRKESNYLSLSSVLLLTTMRLLNLKEKIKDFNGHYTMETFSLIMASIKSTYGAAISQADPISRN